MKVVIVGNGIAGNEVASYLKQQSNADNIDITIISAESFPEYDPCLLPYYLGKETKRDMIFRKNFADYTKQEINLILEDPVVNIDSNTQKVITQKGSQFNYDKLVLAYGGKLFIPAIEGIEKNGVLKSKQLLDVDLLSKHQGKNAVVIGSGAIGIETAVALKLNGYQVTIVELQDRIMPTMFDQTIAQSLALNLKQSGIEVLCGEKVLKILGDNKVSGITTDKRTLPCDTVVIATGVVVDKAITKDTKLVVNRGIKVNPQLETTIESVYACGDCAETPSIYLDSGSLYQLKHNAIEQGRVVAKNILGREVKYSGSYPFARIHFFQTYAASFGKTQTEVKDRPTMQVITRKKRDSILEIIVDQNHIIGAQALGSYAINLGLLMGAMFRGDDLQSLQDKRQSIFDLNSSAPWFYKKLLNLVGE